MAPRFLAPFSSRWRSRSVDEPRNVLLQETSSHRIVSQPQSQLLSQNLLPVGSDARAVLNTTSQSPPQYNLKVVQLWDQALNRIPKDDKRWQKYCEIVQREGIQTLQARTSGASISVQDISNSLSTVRDHSERKGQSRLRQTTEAVLLSLQKGSQIISNVAGTNPYAAAGWGVVAFLISAATTNMEINQFCWKTADALGAIVYRYQTYTSVYLDPDALDSSRLDVEQALVELFVHIIDFQITAVIWSASRSERIKTVFRGSQVTTAAEEISRQEASLETLNAIVSKQSQRIRFNELKALSEQLNTCVAGIDGRLKQVDVKLTTLLQVIDAEHRLRILDWISPVGYDIIHGVKIPMAGTADWLVRGSEYEQWLNENQLSTYWLYGFMGSGKSCVVHAVVEDMKKRLASPQAGHQCLLYYYCSSADVNGKVDTDIVDSIFRVLLKQVADLHKDMMHPLMVATYQTEKPKGPLTAAHCVDLIIKLTTWASRTIIILDGIDECPVSSQRSLLQYSRRLLRGRPKTKLFVASRNEQAIRDNLEDLVPVALNIASYNQGDVEKVIEERIAQAASYTHKSLYIRGPENQRERVASILKQYAGGMFRWVETALSYLHESSTFAEMSDRLEQLPACEDLYILYDEVYNRVSTKAKRSGNELIVHVTLLMLLYGQDLPGFPIDETANTDNGAETCLSEACSFAKSGRLDSNLHTSDLAEYCIGFLVLEKAGQLSIAHSSVREYFSSKHPLFGYQAGHAQIAALCMNVFVETDNKFSPRFGFQAYAAAHWLTHLDQISHLYLLQASQELAINGRFGLQNSLKHFLLGSACPDGFRRWSKWMMELYDRESMWDVASARLLTSPPSTILARIALNHEWQQACFTTPEMRDLKCDDPCRRELSSVLDFAVRARAVPVIQWLVNRGMDVNCLDKNGNTPGHLLLEPDSEFGSEVLRFSPSYSTLDTMEILLSLGANIYRENDFGAIPPVVMSFDTIPRIIDSVGVLKLCLDSGLTTTYVSQQGVAKGRSLVDEIYQHFDTKGISEKIAELVQPYLIEFAVAKHEHSELLCQAARTGSVDLVSRLLERGALTTAYGMDLLQPLKAALSSASIRVGRDMDSPSGRPRQTGATLALLTRACIKAGARLDTIARERHMFRSMMRRDIGNKQATDYSWNTAYFYAIACHCDIDTIKLWAQHGATADLDCQEQGTVLEFAQDMQRCRQPRPPESQFKQIEYSHYADSIRVGTWTEVVDLLETLPGAFPEIVVTADEDEDWFHDELHLHDPKMGRTYTRGEAQLLATQSPNSTLAIRFASIREAVPGQYESRSHHRSSSLR